MIEERLDRMEGILSQLVTMVGNLHTVQEEMLKTLKSFDSKISFLEEKASFAETRFDALESRLDNIEAKNDLRHGEIIERFKRLELDQDFIWEKAVRNERELELLKRRMN
jgi:chromosome segregation ATPase